LGVRRSGLHRRLGRGDQTDRHLHLNIVREYLRGDFIGKGKDQHRDPIRSLEENLEKSGYGLLASVGPAPQKRVVNVDTGETEFQRLAPSGGQKKGAPDAFSVGFIHQPQKTRGSSGFTLSKVLERNWQLGIPQGKS
jgi:hypothetical protein